MIGIKHYIQTTTEFNMTHTIPEHKKEHKHTLYVTAKLETKHDNPIEETKFKQVLDNIIIDAYGNDDVKRLGKRNINNVCTVLLHKIQSKYGTNRMCEVSCNKDNYITNIAQYYP